MTDFQAFREELNQAFPLDLLRETDLDVEGASFLTWLTSVRCHQLQAWRQGKRVPVEIYLEHFASVPLSEEAQIDLICGEVLLRLHQGEQPELADYLERFSGLGEQLRLRFPLLQMVGEPGTDRDRMSSENGGNSVLPKSTSMSGNGVREGDRQPSVRTTTAVGERRALGNAPNIPGYHILKELGRGGASIVYQAEQLNLKKTVALKVLHAGTEASEADLFRFRQEAEVIARLRHPHIIQIFDIGQWGGLSYLALEFVEGGSLDQRLCGQPQEPRTSARLLASLAEAVQAAHEAGVIHRDLKPGNILLQESFDPGQGDWEAKVSDFGLAKVVDTTQLHTRTGAILGTPSYMAPEQIADSPRHIGPATDVYSLGGILYEMLTGRPPFRGQTTWDTLAQVQKQEPVVPSLLQPLVPRDLETICLKCLHKEPTRRYSSARSLAEDLRRFLAGQPIQARPVSLVEKAWRWCWRNPAWATAMAAGLLLFLVLIPGGLLLYLAVSKASTAEQLRAARARELASERRARQAAEQLARTEQCNALFNRVRQREAEHPPGWTWKNARELERLAGLQVPTRDPVALRTALVSCLGEIDLRREKVLLTKYQADCLAFSPDEKYLAVVPRFVMPTQQGHVKLIEMATGKVVRQLPFTGNVAYKKGKPVWDGVRSLAFSSDGQLLAVGTRAGRIHCWDLTEKAPRAMSFSVVGQQEVKQLLFDAAGESLFSLTGYGKTLQCWDLHTAREKARWEPKGGTQQISYDARNHLLLWPVAKGIQTLEANTLKPVRKPLLYRGSLSCLHPGGQFLAIEVPEGEYQRGIEWVHRETGKPWKMLRDPSEGVAHGRAIHHLQFSADGSLMLSASRHSRDRTVKLWEVASGRLLASHPLAERAPRCVLLSPSGKRIAVAAENSVTLYEVAQHGIQTFVAHHATAVRAFRFTPDGRSLVCVPLPNRGAESFAGLTAWNTTNHRKIKALGWHFVPIEYPKENPLCLHPNAKALAFAACDWQVLAWDKNDQQLVSSLTNRPEDISYLAFSRDGKTLWAIVADHWVYAWKWPEKKLALKWENDDPDRLVSLYALATTQKGVVVACRNGKAFLFSGLQAKPIVLQGPGGPLRSAAVHPNQSVAALCTQDGKVRLVPLPSLNGNTLSALKERGDFPGLPQGNPVELHQHHQRINSLAFSSDGSLLATGSQDRTVQLYSIQGMRTKHLLALRFPASVEQLAFHPHRHQLAVLLRKETAVRIWHLDRLRDRLEALGLAGRWPSYPPSKRPTPPAVEPVRKRFELKLVLRRHVEPVNRVCYSPDGKQLFSGGDDWLIKRWDASTGKEMTTFKGHRGPVFSFSVRGDGQQLASVGYSEQHVRLWDLSGRKRDQLFAVPGVSRLCCASYDPQGTRLGLASLTGNIWIVSFPKGRVLKQLKAGCCDKVCWSPDGRRIAFVGDDHTLRLWDSEAGNRIRTLGKLPFGPLSLEFTPNGERLVTAGLSTDIHVWDVATGKIHSILRGHTAGIRTVDISPNGKYLASGSDDHSIQIWNLASGKQCMVIPAHDRGVLGLAFHPSGKQIASCSWDRTVKVWNLKLDGQ